MEVVFQHKREDMDAFYDYMLSETPEGKRAGKQAFNSLQLRGVLFVTLLSSLYGGLTGKGGIAFLLAIGFSILLNGAFLLEVRFKPYYYFGKQLYKKLEKNITPKDLQVFQLQRTLSMDEKWLEVRSSEGLHRYRWRQVKRIGITSNFIFIHVGNCPVIYVPKRDLPSEQSFAEFGKKLVELKEKNEDQPIGIE